VRGNGYTHCNRLVEFIHWDSSCPLCEEDLESWADPTLQIPPPLGGPNFVCVLWESLDAK
jgi:hypothetical protein